MAEYRVKFMRCTAAVVGALAFLAVQAVPVAAGPVVKTFSVGASTNQAGGHPDVEIHATFDGRHTENGVTVERPPGDCNCEDAQGLDIHLPTGFSGSPHNVPECTLAQFSQTRCPVDSQVGIFDSTFGIDPIYNMQPHPGETGLLAFELPIVESPSFTTLHARTGSDYGLDADSTGIVHLFPVEAADIYLWGVPALSSHDRERFPVGRSSCIQVHYPNGCFEPVPSNSPPLPFLENPTTCGLPLSAGIDVHYYDGSTAHAEQGMAPTVGCDQLSFNPSLTALPTTTAADTASGLDLDLKVPQTQNATVPSPSEIHGLTVTLPKGLSLDPNAADGKTSCSDAQLNFTSEGAAECPEFAKVGTLVLDSSALPGPIPGAMYIGEPKPGQVYRLFLTADGFGTHVKLKGDIHLDPLTGQVVTVFENLPQAPFQDFNLHFFGSERGLFATPTQCGTYPVESEFVPWDSLLSSQISLSSFTIDSGPNGSSCPGPSRPFSPRFDAGTPDNTAGTATPLAVQFKREDGDQFLSGITVGLPKGLIQSIKGVGECPQSALDTFALSGYSGLTETSYPACPVSSQIGTMITGTGTGTRELYNSGKIFLAGPYKGAPLSLEFVIPALGGPYDLGNVAVRAAVHIDPVSAQITTVSDPLPQILSGVPLRVRSILLDLDRRGFNLTPTNCSQKSIDGQITGDQGAVSNIGVPFQVANCADLSYAPRLSFKLSGGLARLGHPAIHALLKTHSGEANSGQVSVALPPNEQLDNAHIRNICTRVAFAQEACPASSAIGTAEATTPLLYDPLKGNVYLRANPTHKLPDIVAALKGQIEVEVVGRVDSTKKGGLRTSFETLPDAPVTSVRLDLDGGGKGLIVNSKSVCSHIGPVVMRMEGQNGRRVNRNLALGASCGNARHKRHLQREKAVG